VNKTRTLYQVDQLPIFQNRMYDTEPDAKTCPKGDVRLVEDLQTGLVYNEAFKPGLMVYDERYQNEQAVSPVFLGHLNHVAEIIERTIGRKAIVEVGCGKGFFLEMMLAKGLDVTGYDPIYEGSNPRIQSRYFTPNLGVKADGLILRHVLEHIQDPVGFLFSLKEANGGGGKIYIEVPCFEWICRRRAWFDIYYEHANYFRLSDFQRMFGAVHESGRLFDGQYLYVVADLSSLRRPVYDPTDPVSFPGDFLRNLEHKTQSAGLVAIWGGASKGVIFALLKERAGTPVDIVIDLNPAKQGKYLPATGLRVRSPEDALSRLPRGATIFVMNSNYLSEIQAMSSNAYIYEGVDHE
jgi:hypothetical protein